MWAKALTANNRDHTLDGCSWWQHVGNAQVIARDNRGVSQRGDFNGCNHRDCKLQPERSGGPFVDGKTSRACTRDVGKESQRCLRLESCAGRAGERGMVVCGWGRGWLDDGFTQYVSAAVETTWWIHTLRLFLRFFFFRARSTQYAEA